MKKTQHSHSNQTWLYRFEHNFRLGAVGGLTFVVLFALLLLTLALNVLPKNMTGALFVMILFGSLLYYLGSHLPIVKTYLGGGSVFTTLVAALLAWAGWIPTTTVATVRGFLSTSNFLELYIVALIISAILKMDRALLLQSAVRFLPVAFLSLIVTFLMVSTTGMLLGLGFTHTALYVTFPMMAGGVGAGIVPLASIYGEAFGQSAGPILSQLFPPLVLSNLLVISGAGLLVSHSQDSPWNGQGALLKQKQGQDDRQQSAAAQQGLQAQNLLTGLLIGLAFFMLAQVCHALLPAVNAFAFLILMAVLAKTFSLVPAAYEQAAVDFGQLIVQTMTKPVLAGVGIALLDLDALMHTFSWQLFVCVLVSVLTLTFTAGYLGYLFGLYPVEAAITAGMVNNSMGGVGNVAVLSAANRLNLIAFAQMGTRIGGALVLVIAGFWASFL
ncbi:2-hydroxycarboxylate transporter family protein [Leuconostocaceae bacterium ESL0958]|nr:2-hydroxycarboxylate transporter family protein [Leuconostocaceae bacterium ESL0958]